METKTNKTNNIDDIKAGNFGFLQAGGTGGGGRIGRHHNPIKEALTDPNDLEAIWKKYGCKSKKDLILHMSHSEGYTDGAILKTIQTLVPDNENLLQPQIYQIVEQSLKTGDWLRRRIMMHLDKGHPIRITKEQGGSYGAAAERLYDELTKDSKKS